VAGFFFEVAFDLGFLVTLLPLPLPLAFDLGFFFFAPTYLMVVITKQHSKREWKRIRRYQVFVL
jgi:hypothetical protein